MESLRHPNIVMFMGACTKSPGNLAIVLEFCKNNCLWALLQDLRIPLSWEKRLELAIGVAKGMMYLHSFAVPVLHRDLKSLNVLLDEYYTPKIADFGWTRLLAEKMTLKVGTFQWMAPEVILTKTYTEKADVYSFGIILWEIASREPPYKSRLISSQWISGECRSGAERSETDNSRRLSEAVRKADAAMLGL